MGVWSTSRSYMRVPPVVDRPGPPAQPTEFEAPPPSAPSPRRTDATKATSTEFAEAQAVPETEGETSRVTGRGTIE